MPPSEVFIMGSKTPESNRPRHLHLRTPHEALEVLKKIGVDPYGIEAMLPKMSHCNILLEGIKCSVANIIKQEMLSLGGDAAVSRSSVSCSVAETDVVIMGTEKQLRRFADKISLQPLGLKAISMGVTQLLTNLAHNSFILKTSRREMILSSRTHIMGILNITPDSFSDGGMFLTTEDAIQYGVNMAESGADIIDVGGESSRPGADPVSVEEEMSRVVPVITELANRVNIPISIDTTKAEIARAALACGAEIVNDIGAMRLDDNMVHVIADTGAAVVLMHMRGTPRDMQTGDLSYPSLMGNIIEFLGCSINEAVKAGISENSIIIDPGIGFGKTGEDNLRLLKNLSEFKIFGRPILIGVSRKAFIGKITGGTPLERTEGTAAAVTAAIMNGANIVRVHDVKAMKKVVDVADAIIRIS